ncbi:HEAT repeat domain-containing protein [Luteimonas sp. gir]|uniref:HEAT repeat domain-containing protein n=1 Tax=Luteimonas sp. gir TaxID=3127960 RepID=UPI003075C39B
MTTLELPTAGPERRTVAGLDIGTRADGLTNILAVLDSRSTFVDDYTPLLRAAASAGEFRGLAEVLLECIDDESLVGKAAYQTEDQIEICRDEAKTILLVKVPEMDLQQGVAMAPGGHQFVRSQLDLLPNDASFVFLGDGAMELRMLQVEPQSCGERLEDRGVFSFSGGDVMTVRRGQGVFDTISVKGTVWLLQLVINEHSDLVYHYDRQSLSRTGVSSANFHASRMEFVMDILRQFPVEGSLEELENIYDSSRFYFVRWKAVQTLLKMDLQRGADVLIRASSDDHPQVRVAAERTIQNLRRHGHI